MNNKLRLSFFLVSFVLCFHAVAQNFDKASYYAAAEGKKGQALKAALSDIIKRGLSTVGYDGLLEAYKKTDVRPDGKIWDMYSNATNYTPGAGYAASYKVEGDGYNREHTIPQSVFGSGGMKSDLYHVYPTDSKINGVRSNYCHGEVGAVKTASKGNFSLLGAPTASLKSAGCSEGYVFEPNDLYKGDFARTYFYFITCYEDNLRSFDPYGMFSKNVYPSLTNWAKDMLLRWSEQDVVSDKETTRIEAVYSLQHNRNPFIDYPGLEQYIWGDYQEMAFSPTDYVNPYESGSQPGDDDGGDDGDDDDDTGDDDDKGEDGDDDGGDMATTYSATYTFQNKTWGAYTSDGEETSWKSNGKAPNGFTSMQGVQVTSGTSGAGATSPIRYSDVKSVKVMYTTNASRGAGSIAISVGGESLHCANASVTIEGGTTPREMLFTAADGPLTGAVAITVTCTTNSIYIYSITINGGTDPADAIDPVMAEETIGIPIIFDLSGRRVQHTTRLLPGIYVINGRKVVVR